MQVYEHNEMGINSLSVVYWAGSLYEKAGQRGTRHLMEHLTSYLLDDMMDEFSAKGIFHNAYTSSTLVVFEFGGISEYMNADMRRRIVEHITGNFHMDDVRFSTEKQVVLEEYGDTFSDPLSGSLYNALRKEYGYAGPIGVRKDVEAFTYDAAVRTHADVFSRPVKIIEVGDSEGSYPSVTYSEGTLPEKVVPGSESIPSENCDRQKSNLIGLSTTLVSKEDAPALNVAMLMLSDGLKSPLYHEIREKRGLSYYQFMNDQAFGDTASVLLGSCTEKGKEQELLNVYSDVLGNLDAYMTQDRYDIIHTQVYAKEKERGIFRCKNFSDLVYDGLYYSDYHNAEVTYAQALAAAHKYLASDRFEFMINP